MVFNLYRHERGAKAFQFVGRPHETSADAKAAADHEMALEPGARRIALIRVKRLRQ